MTPAQRKALNSPCYFGFDTTQQQFRRMAKGYSVNLTVNAGYE